uniref:Tudor domain-containing protein n=1 Tax=Caenorhabditis japonica TaxID=281687 RepID=A0A8R1ELU7_CAEJA
MAETCPYDANVQLKLKQQNWKSIQRMPLKDTAIVEMVRIESPSSIFVRPKNHIRDRLIYREPYKLSPLTHLEPGQFALAPLEERVFGRCVILRTDKTNDECRVFFIDDGITSSVNFEVGAFPVLL